MAVRMLKYWANFAWNGDVNDRTRRAGPALGEQSNRRKCRKRGGVILSHEDPVQAADEAAWSNGDSSRSSGGRRVRPKSVASSHSSGSRRPAAFRPSEVEIVPAVSHTEPYRLWQEAAQKEPVVDFSFLMMSGGSRGGGDVDPPPPKDVGRGGASRGASRVEKPPDGTRSTAVPATPQPTSEDGESRMSFASSFGDASRSSSAYSTWSRSSDGEMSRLAAGFSTVELNLPHWPQFTGENPVSFGLAPEPYFGLRGFRFS